MPYYSPLRYPGGKRRLVQAVTQLLAANRLKDVNYAEPFAGGAAIGLALLFDEYASTIHINDLSRPVYAFWHTVLNDSKDLCRRVELARLTRREWEEQRSVYQERDTAPLADLGFAALYLNRTNRSGIIDGGVIGGTGQASKWGIGARFNPDDLVVRIRRIARYKARIHLYQADALEFMKGTMPALGRNSFAFCDPPYIENGEGLYLNDYGLDDHRLLAASIEALTTPWVVTYDCAAIGALFSRHRRIVYGLHYSAATRYEGREVMFLSPGLTLPDSWLTDDLIPLSSRANRYPLWGKMENAG